MIEVTADGSGIVRLAVCDPERENRLSAELVDALMATLDKLAADPSVKVLLVTGTREVWCAGGTLTMLKEMASGVYDERRLLALSDRLLSFPVPVVGALEGHAVGGGLALALCCDLTVAAEERRYAVNSASMGFAPAMGLSVLLPAAVGHHVAAEMIFTGKYYKGRELADRRLFNAVVPGDEVLAHATDLAEQIAEKPRYVLELLKETLALPKRHLLQEAVAREPLMNRICFNQPGSDALLDQTYLN
ncbi:polyketide synthase [Micromonospora sp. WMMD882]|uniref:polyketide synthase n=1 Tax=Micromonospora sp. WMMD882 TaxID=3015151 RepID=UPI00248B7972|nr:polyketide synthase [Micromonospora sp. WMMD882]WBB82279.1 polyketide synthase [Micromonospora sp. WMMD882]